MKRLLSLGKLTVPFLILWFVTSCDIFTPKVHFTIAIPEGDFTYNTSANHLKKFLEKGNFDIDIVQTENAIEANRMVATGDADLTFIMNHSDFIPEAVGEEAAYLRSIAPMFRRLFFIFSRFPVSDSLTARELLEGRRVGVEVLNGETHTNLSNLFKSGQIENIGIVTVNDTPDLIHFWGTYYGQRATNLIENDWEELSIDPAWVDFITLNDPALSPFTLPSIPGVAGSKNLNTFSVETLLVTNDHIGENAIYRLSQYIFQHRLELIGYDIMYRSLNDAFDISSLLYPLHFGTDAYLRRDEPSFFEKYAEVLALIFSVGAVLYGGIQTIRTQMSRRMKERIDLYFLDFLEIRSKQIAKEDRAELLDDLLQRALLQMTNEKLDKGDFHIFSRLVQQELANLR